VRPFSDATSAAGATPLGRVRALDGLRGVAIALVVLRHYWPGTFPGGGIVGVDLFFGLSGFLITSLLLGEHAASGRISLRRFYVRRALRLYPALYAMLALYLLFVVFGDARTPTHEALVGAGYVSVYGFNWAKAASVNLPVELGPLWTLSVEEQFYLFWPLALILLLRVVRSPRGLVRATAVGVLALWVLRPILWHVYGSSALYYFTTTWADALLCGAVLAILRHYGLLQRVRASLASAPVVAVSLAALAAGLFYTDLKSAGVTYWIVLPVYCIAICSLVVAVVDRPAAVTTRAAGLRPLVALGVISYALYLYNELVHELLAQHFGNLRVIVGGIPLALLLAAASRFFVERPALSLKARFEPARVAPELNPGAPA